MVEVPLLGIYVALAMQLLLFISLWRHLQTDEKRQAAQREENTAQPASDEPDPIGRGDWKV